MLLEVVVLVLFLCGRDLALLLPDADFGGGASDFGSASFTSTALVSMMWWRFAKALASVASLSKMTNPNPRDLLVSRLYIT